MVSCDNVKALFSDYLDNLTSSEQMQLVDQHLKQCPSCKETFVQLQSITARVKKMQTISASADFDKNLRSKIMQPEASRSRYGSVRNISYGFSGVAVFAALTFFVLTTVNTPNLETQPGSISGSKQNIQKEIIINNAGTSPKLASETIKNDSLKNRPEQLDQKIQLVDQEK